MIRVVDANFSNGFKLQFADLLFIMIACWKVGFMFYLHIYFFFGNKMFLNARH